ncbi:MAG TPA: histidinol-phosphate transaminase [Pseudomonadales bacterium]
MARRVNANVAGLSPYRPGKPIEELARELGLTDIVKLASNENPRGVSGAVQETIRRAAAGVSRYPDGSGYELKRALAAHLGVAPEQITLGNGSNDVLNLAARMAIAPGAAGIVAEHAFIVHPLAVTLCGGRLVQVPARDYAADLPAMLEAVTDHTAIVFLANPNNPTGTWVDEAALGGFLRALPEEVWLVLDEAYFEYVDAPGYPNGIRLIEQHPNLIVTRTFSKIHGLAGLRVGYAVSSPEAADLMNRAREPFNVNALAQAAAVTALADSAYVTESRALNRQGMAALTAGLEQLGLAYIPSVGNFVTFEVPSRIGAGAAYQALLREGVIVRPVPEYGLPAHLRVTVGLPEENQRFLEALQRVLG